MSLGPRRQAPTDSEAAAVWSEIMRMASDACLIVQAYGGVASLALPDEQRKAGVRQTVLNAEWAEEGPAPTAPRAPELQ